MLPLKFLQSKGVRWEPALLIWMQKKTAQITGEVISCGPVSQLPHTSRRMKVDDLL